MDGRVASVVLDGAWEGLPDRGAVYPAGLPTEPRAGTVRKPRDRLVASPAVRTAVLVSGTGSILEAIVAHGVPVALVGADRPCAGLDRAAAAGVPTLEAFRCSFGPDFDRDRYSARLARDLARRGIDIVAMAGFGTILGPSAHDAYGGRIINTHPALLPAFPGWHAVRAALDARVTMTGCTIHVASLEVDSGPILAQEAVPVFPTDDETTLHERIKQVERRLYPQTLADIIARGRVLPDASPGGQEP